MRPARLKQEVASEDGQPGARRLEANHGVTPSGASARGKRLELSAELLSILLVGVALAALILTGIGGIREGAGLKLSTPSAFGSVYAGAQHVVWLHVRPFGDTLLTKCHVDA